jgi:Rps23 Pro-64 3,4-dihydroxylase Tpa1-like proline 4-hydroxylase
VSTAVLERPPLIEPVEPVEADLDRLNELAQQGHEAYQNATPFAHAVFDNFLRPEVLEQALRDFPKPNPEQWSAMVDKDQKKFACNVPSQLAPSIRRVIHFLNSREVINFLEALTGIKGLIPDPHLAGGGLHELRPGGFLKVHADFNWHQQLRLDRRINLLVYLNKDWPSEYEGNLELWDTSMTHCVKKIEPLFNRCVIFNTNNDSYHGNPVPVACPPDRSRRSIAMYYYTNGRPTSEVSESHGTLFRNRPGEATAGEMATSLAHKLVPPVLVDAWRAVKRR